MNPQAPAPGQNASQEKPKGKNQLSKARQRALIVRAGRYMAMATQIPFTVAAGYLLGNWLDGHFGTTWLKPTVLILAIVGVFTQLIWQLMRDQKSK